ncbi:MAG: very short patch repair endonuclease [Gemmatimonadetes bacterium]|nr:very short patch repair endonuclease [Gemmatimonadota bacterium]
MDNLTPAQRRYCMSRIKGRDTRLEIRVRSALHRRGLRFRKHVKDLPGTPDVAFIRAKLAVFIDGDFWHGHGFPSWKNTLSGFWRDKISKNIERDRRNELALRDQGWRILRLWQHEIENDLQAAIDRVAAALGASVSVGGRTSRRIKPAAIKVDAATKTDLHSSCRSQRAK